MSDDSNLDSSEDLDNLDSVALVRMADVQPIDRSLQDSEEILETCIIDDTEYECIVDDEESNVGSTVSVQSEEVVYDDGSIELIIPEVVEPEYLEDPDTDLVTPDAETNYHMPPQTKVQDSWPTLEILPGGVINKNGCNITEDNNRYMEPNGMLYACAKCSESFKYLYCLVKHVKTHQEEKKKPVVSQRPNQSNKYICLKPKIKRRMKLKTKARKMPKKS